MPNGFGRGFGSRGGMGFGFRGSSPPWPYVGRGRGGLPRCSYFLGGATGSVAVKPPAFGTAPFTPQMTGEQELDFLRDQANMIKSQLEQIESRMRDLETKEK